MNKNNIELITLSYKIIIIGDHCVGKSTILNSLVQGKFVNQVSTIGIDFKTKNVLVDNVNIKLNIWDTAGQERFRTIVGTFYRHAQAIMIMYDITDLESFESIHSWLDDCTKVLGTDTIKSIPIILIGNKSDLEEKRQVSNEYAQNVADNLGFLLIETSAKNIELVNDAFVSIGRVIKNKYYKKNIVSDNNNKYSTINITDNKSIKLDNKTSLTETYFTCYDMVPCI